MKKFLSLFIILLLLLTSVPGSAETAEEPLFTIACFSDLHVDYGIQNRETPIRKTTIEAANFVKNKFGGADLVMVGGDMTSQDDKNSTWTEESVNKVRDCIQDTMATASKDGKVIYITGNHDSQAGVAAGGTFWSGDYEKYMLATLGEYDAAFYREGSKYEELLCYRYNIRGLEFIGINTPSIADASNTLFSSQLKWVESELEKIGKDKTVIILCHYPVVSLREQGTDENESPNYMNNILSEYPNVIYCYGHAHGSEEWYVRADTSELVNVRESGGIDCHMGSMSYYKNPLRDDWLTADEPEIVQLMMISFYGDRIEFQMYNTGEMSASESVYELKAFTVERDMIGLIIEETSSVPETLEDEDDSLRMAVVCVSLVALIAILVAILVKRGKKKNKIAKEQKSLPPKNEKYKYLKFK